MENKRSAMTLSHFYSKYSDRWEMNGTKVSLANSECCRIHPRYIDRNAVVEYVTWSNSGRMRVFQIRFEDDVFDHWISCGSCMSMEEEFDELKHMEW